jgi:hypothetical protein
MPQCTALFRACVRGGGVQKHIGRVRVFDTTFWAVWPEWTGPLAEEPGALSLRGPGAPPGGPLRVHSRGPYGPRAGLARPQWQYAARDAAAKRKRNVKVLILNNLLNVKT